MAVSVWTVPDFVIPFALPYFVAVIFPENPFHVGREVCHLVTERNQLFPVGN